MVILKVFSIFFTIYVVNCDEGRKPMYKYRYETEDVMKTAETGVPVRGYHVVEGGYYPTDAVGAETIGRVGGIGGYSGGIGLGYGGYGGIGPGFGGGFGGGFGNGFGSGYIPKGPIGFGGGYQRGGFYPSAGLSHVPFIPHHHHHHHGIGGEEFDKKSYSDEKKNHNDGHYEKAGGKKEEVVDHGEEGYSKGNVVLKEGKGDSGYYNDQKGGKKVYEDGKQYHGDQHFDKQGKNGLEKKEKKGHKKGHVIKGFKTSHHKDESGKTEEYYDEEHDEGDNYNFNGQSGSFGEKAQSSYKGGHENGEFNVEQAKKQGKFENVHAVDKSNGDQGTYGQKKYGQSGHVYGSNNGIDESSLLGHQESSRAYKHFPYHVPIFAD